MTTPLFLSAILAISESSPYYSLQDTLESTISSGVLIIGVVIIVIVVAVILNLLSNLRG